MYSVNTSWLCKAMKNLIVNKSWGWAEAVVSVSLTLHKQQTVLLRGCHETLFIIWMKIEASVKGSPVQAKACWRRTQSLTSTHWTTIQYSSLVFIVSLTTLSLSFVIMFFETISKFKNSAVTKGIVLFWLWVLSRTSYHIRVHHMIPTNDVKIWCIFKTWWFWYRQIPK